MDPMILSVLIFLVAYIFIASEKIDKSIAAILGAGLMIICGVVDFHFTLTKIDLNVLGLLIGMMIIVNIMATTGIFEWVAIIIAKKAKGNGLLVVTEFLLATALISAFMDNVTTVILMAPVTILIAQLLKLPVVPILILEAIFSNIGGTATLIGDPPNIIIGAKCHLAFNEFIGHLGPVTLIIIPVCLAAILLIFRKKFVSDPDSIRQVMMTEPERAILDPKRLNRALFIFALILLGFFTGQLTGIEPGLVAICGAFLMALVCRIHIHEMLEKVEWPTIMFFCGLFMMIAGLEHNHVFEHLGTWILGLTGGHFALTLMIILWSSAVLSAIVDNIPLVIAMIPLIIGIIPAFIAAQHGLTLSPADMAILGSPEAIKAFFTADTTALYAKLSDPALREFFTPEIFRATAEPLFWSLALGACLGGNGTLIGASANVVIAQVANKNNYPISFGKFTLFGAPITLVSLLICSVYILIRYV